MESIAYDAKRASAGRLNLTTYVIHGGNCNEYINVTREFDLLRSIQVQQKHRFRKITNNYKPGFH